MREDERGREGGASRKRVGGEGGRVQLLRVDARGVRLRAAAAAHPQERERKKGGNYLKQTS